MEEFKICTTCKRKIPLQGFHKQPAGKYGRTSRCKKCYSIYARKYNLATRHKRIGRYAKDPVYRRMRRKRSRGDYLKAHYGLTLKQYTHLLKQQKYRCSICKNTVSKTSYDLID